MNNPKPGSTEKSNSSQTKKKGPGKSRKAPPGGSQTTSRVVQLAASILEEEIAAGIVAAKQIEERLFNPKELRSEKSAELMMRFRRDAHEVVDILMDVLTMSAQYMGRLADTVFMAAEAGSNGNSSPAAPTVITSLTLPNSLKAGESGETVLTLENSGDSPMQGLEFSCTDLVDASGQSIPFRQISFKPRPLNLKPEAEGKVRVKVKIPKGTPAGVYNGLIQSPQMPQRRAVLTVRVAE